MWKYVGDQRGAYVPGMPQADLTDEEWAAYPQALRDIAKHDKIFEHVNEGKAKSKADDGS